MSVQMHMPLDVTQEQKQYENEQFFELHATTMKAKIEHCCAEEKYISYLRGIDAKDADIPLTQNEKDVLRVLRDNNTKSKELLTACIDALNKIINPMYRGSYLEMWEKVPICFAKLLLRIKDYPITTISLTSMDEIINVSKYVKMIDAGTSLQLIKENDLIRLIEPISGFKSSACIVCHVGNESLTQKGTYRTIAFLTQSGSVYHCCGDSLEDYESNKLLKYDLLKLSDHGLG